MKLINKGNWKYALLHFLFSYHVWRDIKLAFYAWKIQNKILYFKKVVCNICIKTRFKFIAEKKKTHGFGL
jgi:hypothetical protein